MTAVRGRVWKKKLSYRWQTARRLCTSMLRYSWHKTLRSSFPCCDVKSCSLVNDCDLLAGFSDFYLPFFNATPSIPSSYRVQTRMAGLQSGKGRRMIDSAHERDRQPRRHSKCRVNALHRVAKMHCTTAFSQHCWWTAVTCVVWIKRYLSPFRTYSLPANATVSELQRRRMDDAKHSRLCCTNCGWSRESLVEKTSGTLSIVEI